MAMEYRLDLEPPVIYPPQSGTPHTHTVVFLHGRGDNAKSFSDSVTQDWRDAQGRTLSDLFPSFRWVFPQAPVRTLANSPKQRMRQWFDVWDSRDFNFKEDLSVEGLREIVPRIRVILAEEAALLGGQWHRVVLAGISMGGATSAHILFNFNIPDVSSPRLGAFMGFSARCPFVDKCATQSEMQQMLDLPEVPQDNAVIRNTPMMLQHCADDPVVPVQTGEQLKEKLQAFGATVDWNKYPLGGHWFKSPEGVEDAEKFLRVHLAGLVGPNTSLPSHITRVPSIHQPCDVIITDSGKD